MRPELRLRVPATSLAPRSARQCLDGLAPFVPRSALETARLLLSELVTNSYRHARLTEHDCIDVRAWAAEDGLRVEVRDPGIGIPAEREPPRAGEPSGWGLYLVDHLARRWAIEREPQGTLV